MAATEIIHVRVDEKTKTQATEALAAMGLSVSDAIRVFLKRVAAEKAMPFELRVPNAETRAAMEEARAMTKERKARFSDGQALFDALDKEAGE